MYVWANIFICFNAEESTHGSFLLTNISQTSLKTIALFNTNSRTPSQTQAFLIPMERPGKCHDSQVSPGNVASPGNLEMLDKTDLLLLPPAPKLNGSTMSNRPGFEYTGFTSNILDLVPALSLINYSKSSLNIIIIIHRFCDFKRNDV